MREVNELGAIAKRLDSEMTTFERMKLRKSTFQKLGIALLVYAGTMGLMSLAL